MTVECPDFKYKRETVEIVCTKCAKLSRRNTEHEHRNDNAEVERGRVFDVLRSINGESGISE